MLRTSLTILAAAGLAATAHADRMFAVGSSIDAFIVFDTDTGDTISTVGPLHPDAGRYTTAVSMAAHPYRGIYILNNSPASDAGLSEVDRRTGLASHIGGDVGGAIAFDRAGRLYGVGAGSELGTVDLATGNVTSLGGDALPRLYGLDFNAADGFLYGVTSPSVSVQPELLKIDPSSGVIVSTVVMSDPTVGSVPGSIAFEDDGTLIMTENGRVIWEVDTATGAMRQRTSSSTSPQGLGTMACGADFDSNGRVDIFDFLAFQNAFSASERRADIDGDGSLTIFDFLAFQNLFDAGC